MNPLPVILLAVLVVLLGAFAVYGTRNIWGKKPQLTLNGESVETVEGGGAYVDPGATAMLGNEDISNQVTVSGTVDMTKPGDYSLTYSVTYRKETYSVSRLVSVRDTKGPDILLNEPEGGMELTSMDQFTDPGFTATDAVDGDLTSRVSTEQVQVDENLVMVVYTVTDSSGNTATADRMITLKPAPPETEAAAADSGDSIICLTFDDGPSTKVTPRILDILKENDVKATFFIINYEESMIPLLQRMIDEGHTIGIHTWSHEYSECYASMDSYYEGVIRLRDKLKEDTGYEAFCCRFPGGASNTVSKKYTPGVMTYLAEKMPAEGFQYYDWNADSTDAEGNNRPVETLVKNATDGFKQGRTNILLCHDTNAKETTADALQQIIDYGRKNGFIFQPITKNTKPVHHGINN